jgi:flagellar protein FlaJ
VFNVVNILAITVFIVPVGIIRYSKHKTIKEIESQFPDFMRELVEGLRGGMSLPLAIKYAAKGDYGALNPHVRKIVSQISWGIPFEKALENFIKDVKSRVIGRAVSVIIEAHRSGGELAEAIESVTKATTEVEKIRSERRAIIASQMMQGYLIFFVFIGIMIGIQEFLLPTLASEAFSPTAGTEILGTEITEVSRMQIDINEYVNMFSRLAIIQGIFAGLVIGKLAEGTISAGTKHAIIMSLMGYMALVMAHSIFG